MRNKSAQNTGKSSEYSVHEAYEDRIPSTESSKHVRKRLRDIRREMKHDLDFSYIDHFKEKINKFRSDESNFTYVTVVVKAILEEPEDEST